LRRLCFAAAPHSLPPLFSSAFPRTFQLPALSLSLSLSLVVYPTVPQQLPSRSRRAQQSSPHQLYSASYAGPDPPNPPILLLEPYFCCLAILVLSPPTRLRLLVHSVTHPPDSNSTNVSRGIGAIASFPKVNRPNSCVVLINALSCLDKFTQQSTIGQLPNRPRFPKQPPVDAEKCQSIAVFAQSQAVSRRFQALERPLAAQLSTRPVPSLATFYQEPSHTA
jgi:hypothetical protein